MEIFVLLTEVCAWSLVCGAGVSWTKLSPFKNTLHDSEFPSKTTPTSIGCMAVGTATQGCNYVTYVQNSSTCYRHTQLQGRQSIKDSRVWSNDKRCADDFMYSETRGGCVYISNVVRTWFDSQSDCEARNASLLVTTSQQDISAVANASFGEIQAWVGGTKEGARSNWISGDVVYFSDFAAVDNVQVYVTGNKPCLAFTFSSQNELLIRNLACSELLHYICESISS